MLQQTNTQKRNQIKLVTLLPRIRSKQMEVAFPYLDASHEGEDASYLETVHSVLQPLAVSMGLYVVAFQRTRPR